MADALAGSAAKVCEAWAAALLEISSGVYQRLSESDVQASATRLFSAYVGYLRSGDPGPLRDAVHVTARRGFEAGQPLVALLETVGAARVTILPVLTTTFAAEPRVLSESVAALMTAEEMAAVWIAEAYETVADAQLISAREERRRAEEDKVAFGRDIARLVTGEKLVLCEPSDIPARPGLSTLPVVKPRDVREARSIVHGLAETLGWPPSRVYELQLCVGEAGTNAIRHAGTATFQAWAEGDEVTFRIADSGPGIDFNRIPSAISSGYSTGSSLGMGFTLMLELADTIRLATDKRGTVLQLTLTRR
jgi:anti-sigma regulatory factor (Ser/Thr protein kinase)